MTSSSTKRQVGRNTLTFLGSPVYLVTHPSTRLSISLATITIHRLISPFTVSPPYPPLRLPTQPPTHTSHHPFIYLPTTHPFVYSPVHPATHLPIHLYPPTHTPVSVLLSIHLLVHFPTTHLSTISSSMHTPIHPNGHAPSHQHSYPLLIIYPHLPTRPCMYLFIHQHTDPPIHPSSTHPTACKFGHLDTHLLMPLSIHSPVFPLLCLSMTTYLPIHSFTHLFIHLHIRLITNQTYTSHASI